MSSETVQILRVGYVCGNRRRSERAQRAMLKADGVERIYDDWSLLMRQRRKGRGDVIVVTDLWVIADPARRTVKGGMRQSMIERRAEARQRGASIFELSSGASTLHADEADDMLSRSLDALANTRAMSKTIGRPPKVYSDHEQTIMRLHWHALRKHPTNRDAIAAMASDGVRVSVQMVTRLLGPSGRKPGGKGNR